MGPGTSFAALLALLGLGSAALASTSPAVNNGIFRGPS
jgi:hypothetical protein